MKKLAIVGYRGMVGSTLIELMKENNDFKNYETTFFSTSKSGQNAPKICENQNDILGDANDINQLSQMDYIISCQGGDYTSDIYPGLIDSKFGGYWIDAASTLRMDDNAVIVLDPVNESSIIEAKDRGVKTFVGLPRRHT